MSLASHLNNQLLLGVERPQMILLLSDTLIELTVILCDIVTWKLLYSHLQYGFEIATGTLAKTLK
jgi:hypothetical protein